MIFRRCLESKLRIISRRFNAQTNWFEIYCLFLLSYDNQQDDFWLEIRYKIRVSNCCWVAAFYQQKILKKKGKEDGGISERSGIRIRNMWKVGMKKSQWPVCLTSYIHVPKSEIFVQNTAFNAFYRASIN